MFSNCIQCLHARKFNLCALLRLVEHNQEGAWQLSHSLANNFKGVHVTETFVMAVFKYGHWVIGYTLARQS